MFIGKRIGRAAAALSLLLSSVAAHAGALAETSKWNMPEGATAISHEVYGLHMLVFWVCVAIGVVVFGVMFYSLFAHRRSKHPVPANFHESTLVEVIWTIIPFIILVALAVPAAGTLIKMYDTRNADMTVRITGVQWRWQYDYVESGISFTASLSPDSNQARQLKSGVDLATVPNYLLSADRNFVVPAGKKVRLLITSNDVIHGWWVPDLAVKRDAIPGYINEVWFKIDEPGIYRGQCTVLCGRDHGFMPIVVEAKTPEEFDAWVKAQKGGATEVASAAPPTGTDATPAAPVAAAPAAPAAVAAAEPAKPAAAPAKLSHDELMKNGEKVYQANCQACHQATGQGMPPTFPPLVGGKIATGPVDGHVTQILKGKNAMPPFADTLKSDTDIAAVATYERNSWGNKAGDVQPAQVAALRGK
jgi:cytochrome c oxidase subunit 2